MRPKSLWLGGPTRYVKDRSLSCESGLEADANPKVCIDSGKKYS